jgi:hypothetical protein
MYNINEDVEINMINSNSDNVMEGEFNDNSMIKLKKCILYIHKSIGHVNFATILEMIIEGYFSEYLDDIPEYMNLIGHVKSEEFRCITCLLSKIKNRKRKSKANRTTGIPFLKGSIDIFGPIALNNKSNDVKYALLYICDDSSYGLVEFMNKKDLSSLKNIIHGWRLFVRDKEYSMERLQFDADPTFEQSAFKEWLISQDISPQFAAPGEHEANGLVERFIQSVSNSAKTLLLASGLPGKYWVYALKYAVFLHNIVIKKRFIYDEKYKYVTPYERVHGKEFNKKLPIFGCLVIARVPDLSKITKLDPRGRRCVFLGISMQSHNCFILLNMETNQIIKSNDIVEINNVYGYTNELIDNNTAIISGHLQKRLKESVDENLLDIMKYRNIHITKCLEIVTNFYNYAMLSHGGNCMNDEKICYNIAYSGNIDIPTSYDEAMTPKFRDKFYPAIKDEIQSHLKYNTLDLGNCIETIDKSLKPLKMKWVFDIKRDINGNIVKYKARLVAKGFMQIYDFNYTSTYAPTLFKESMKLILSIAGYYNLKTIQLDIKTAFLNGVLSEKDIIYVEVPKGFDVYDDNVPKYCRMIKAIYGTKQAAEVFHTHLKNNLLMVGYSNSISDPCLYYKWSHDKFIIFGVFVDDIIGTSTHQNLIDELIENLSRIYEVKVLGEVSKLLGMKVKRNTNNDIFLYNDEYFNNVMHEYNIPINASVTLPYKPNKYYVTYNGDVDDKVCTKYKSIIGTLNFAAMYWRPDIIWIVNHLSRFASKPSEEHIDAAVKVLQYCYNTRYFGIIYRNRNINLDGINPIIMAYCDANWCQDDDGTSTTGYIIGMKDEKSNTIDELNWISFVSKKQSQHVADSTESAETYSIVQATKDILFLRNIMIEIGFKINEPTTIYNDNTSTITNLNNNIINGKNRSEARKHFYARNAIQNGEIIIKYIKSKLNLADAFTKPMDKANYNNIINKIVKYKGLFDELDS